MYKDELAAEEAAEAGASGKDDEVIFQLGHITAFNIDHEECEPVVAAFTRPNAALPSGESGYFDLGVLMEGGYYSYYHQGTFKLSEFRGLNRIRFSDEDGRVIMRKDWG